MKVLDDGHIYELEETGRGEGTQQISFMKRSGGAVRYDQEWDGLQTQEVLRALIHRTIYLNEIIPCVETQDAIWHLRMALFVYEARAYRRKQEGKNRKSPTHDDTARARGWRAMPYDDVPFSEEAIELLPVGDDGHILIED